jgi:hypothetical protein
VTEQSMHPSGEAVGLRSSRCLYTVERMVCRTLQVYERILADAPA